MLKSMRPARPSRSFQCESRVRDVMTPVVFSIRPDAPAHKAIEEMLNLRVHRLFVIDADGVLQDQHVGDAEIEGKLKKLIARASEVASRKTVAELR